MPGDGQVRTVVTARRANHGYGQRYPLPGTAELECEEPVLTGESPPAEKLPGPVRLARR